MSPTDELSESPTPIDPMPVDYQTPGATEPASVTNTGLGRVDVAVIAVRIAALYCWMQATPILFAIPMLFESATSISFKARMLGPYIVPIGIGVILWLSAKWLAAAMLRDVEVSTVADNLNKSPTDIAETVVPEPAGPASGGTFVAEIHAMAISIVAIVIAVYSLRNLPLVAQELFPIDNIDHQSNVYRVQLFVELLAAVLLFFGSTGFSRLWRRIREGSKTAESPL